MLRAVYREFCRLMREKDGVTAMEYGLIAAATVVSISVFMPGITTRLSGIFSRVSTSL